MKLKIQTKPPENYKATREPVQTVKKYEDMDPQEFLVLGLPFGGQFEGRDSDGETFTVSTDAWLGDGKEIPVTYYHGFGPDSPDDWQDIPAVIGVAKYSHNNERGFWFTVRFDGSEPLAKRILNADPDIVRASSGAIGHLVRTREAGIIEVWPVGELALFDTNEWRKPANELAVFMAKAEITEVAAEAETQAAAVDEAEPKVKSLIMEKKPMEEETKEPKAESVIDLDSLVSKLNAISAKLEKLENAPAINAPAIVKSENLGSPDPVRAFAHYLITGEKVKGLKAPLGENTAGVGGYLVPEDSYNSIVEKRNELSIPRRAGASIFQTNRDVFNIQVESTSQTYYAQAAHDMAAVSEDEPTFGNLSGVVYPYTKLVKVSVDLLEDNASNLSQFLTNSFARWAAMTENRISLIGGGGTAPQGVTVGGTAALTFDDTNSIAATEIPELYYKLNQAYRERAVWTMNDDTLGFLRGLSSTSMFTFGAHEINDESIMGKRVYTSGYMPTYSGTGNKSIVFGDWSLYAFIERKGMTIQRLNELYAGNRQVGLLATIRMGGGVMQAEAFAVAKQA